MRTILLALLCLMTLGAGAPTFGAERPYRAPRTVFGQPNLQGVWSNATFTFLERPLSAPHVVMTPEEAAMAAAKMRQDNPLPAGLDVGQDDSERITFDMGEGFSRVRGEIRAGMIVDPVDGRLPYRPEALKRFGLDQPQNPLAHRDNPEDRSLTERCILGEDASPPLVPSPDSNYIQIIQTRNQVALYSEKYHELRIVRLYDRHAPSVITSWDGDEIGWWEGDTLVIETTNFPPTAQLRFGRLRLSNATTVLERFTRTSSGELLYEVKVTDPTLYTQSWRAEVPFKASSARILEDACHEGNYSLPGILAGAREDDRASARSDGR